MRLQTYVLISLIAVAIPTVTYAEKPAAGPTPLGLESADLPAAVEDFDEVRGGVFKDGRVFIAGQPDKAALQQFRDLGVTAVVNLRTPTEMDDRKRVPFDEAAALAELEMTYIHIPLGGSDHPYAPAAVAKFAAVLDAHPGPVLLHCTVAWRASYMWAAYLIRYQNYSLDDALARGEAIAISPPPLEGLLGQSLSLSYAE